LPKKDHPTLGDVQQHVYLRATIKAVYLNSPLVEERLWDTADIELDEGGTYLTCPILYHCSLWRQLRGNGSVESGGRAFIAGDQVFVLAKKAEEKIMEDGCQKFYSEVTVLGFVNGPKKCAYNYALVRISKDDLLPLEPPFGTTSYDSETDTWSYTDDDPDSHSGEMCIFYDYHSQGYPEIRVARDNYGTTVNFPCTVEYIKPFLDEIEFRDVELFDLVPQGNKEDDPGLKFPEASGSVDWRSDISGKDLGVNTIDHSVNPVQQMFLDLRGAFVGDKEGLSTGNFVELDEEFAAYFGTLEDPQNSKIMEWAARSKGFMYDVRANEAVPGSVTSEQQLISEMDEEMQLAVHNYLQRLQREITSIEERLEEKPAEIVNLEELLVTVAERIPPLQDALAKAEITLARLRNAGWGGDVIAMAQANVDRFDTELNSLLQLQEEIPSIRIPHIENEILELQTARQERIEQIQAAAMGEVPFSFTAAYLPDGSVAYNNSVHVAAGYGEDEIWVCGKETYMGIIISYCDKKWKFQRLRRIPPSIPIPGSAVSRLAGDAAFGAVAPGMAGANTGQMVADIGAVIATDIILNSSLGGDTDIFTVALLKRINEGEYHRDSFPADYDGSYLALTTPIPEDQYNEPQYKTALNVRKEAVRVWDRRDNWHNTIGLSFAEFTADRTWWFWSEAQEWRWECRFLDTPLGSMMLETPAFSAGLWWMLELITPMSVYRHDETVFSSQVRIAKQSARMCLQLYLVQRQGLTLWAETEDDFVKQELTIGPYSCKIARDGHDSVRFVEVEGEMQFYDDLDEETKAGLTEDRYYVSQVENSTAFSNMRGGLHLGRNEIEVLAGFETWNRLYLGTRRRCPRDQQRNPYFEQAINELVQYFYDNQENIYPSTLMDFNMDARIL
jgi:hypothetical protein